MSQIQTSYNNQCALHGDHASHNRYRLGVYMGGPFPHVQKCSVQNLPHQSKIASSAPGKGPFTMSYSCDINQNILQYGQEFIIQSRIHNIMNSSYSYKLTITPLSLNDTFRLSLWSISSLIIKCLNQNYSVVKFIV